MLAPPWTPRGIAQRFRAVVGHPRNLPLFVQVGWFIATAPNRMAKTELSSFVRTLREGALRRADRGTLSRMRAFWLVRFFPRHNTCYIRAMTLYRFLQCDTGRLRLHFGIEHRSNSRERLHGHAWVSHDGSVIEGPPIAFTGGVREIVLEKSG
ncbi:MAG: lasso peptide biosynthesis protein [Candidatus Baltobacteraceae bacterium]